MVSPAKKCKDPPVLTMAFLFCALSPMKDFRVFSWVRDCTLEFVSTSLITIKFWFRFGLDEVTSFNVLLMGECLIKMDYF